MKKILFFILIILIILSTSCCGFLKKDNGRLKITTTIFPYYSFAKEVCGDKADVTMLIKPGAETHTYEPTTQEIIDIQNSDIFIYTGGESDEWVKTVLNSIDTKKVKIIRVFDYIQPINDEHHGYDEHVWTSLKNSCIITQIISDKLCEINPENSDFYKQNTSVYLGKLKELDKEFENIFNSYSKTIIFADKFPFAYFAEDYGLKYISAFPSCSEESEPSVQTMAKIIETVNRENISSVFYIEFSNQKIADTIISETNSNKYLFHSCHNITKSEFDSGASYFSLMQQNLSNLKEAIK